MLARLAITTTIPSSVRPLSLFFRSCTHLCLLVHHHHYCSVERAAIFLMLHALHEPRPAVHAHFPQRNRAPSLRMSLGNEELGMNKSPCRANELQNKLWFQSRTHTASCQYLLVCETPTSTSLVPPCDSRSDTSPIVVGTLSSRCVRPLSGNTSAQASSPKKRLFPGPAHLGPQYPDSWNLNAVSVDSATARMRVIRQPCTSSPPLASRAVYTPSEP